MFFRMILRYLNKFDLNLAGLLKITGMLKCFSYLHITNQLQMLSISAACAIYMYARVCMHVSVCVCGLENYKITLNSGNGLCV